MKNVRWFGLVCCLAWSCIMATPATPENEQQAMAQRLAPVGESKVVDDSHMPPLTLEPEAVAAKVAAPTAPVAPVKPATPAELARGKQIYEAKCHVCHESGLAGAPKFGDASAWTPRIQKGVPALLQSAKTGLNAMPPKGTCTDCTDPELQDAIEYMISQSGVKPG